ncbi:low molecular weight phosphatase family protein [Candidatus Heimdallarchaeota archaeon B3_Heim]|nr:MAG: low molecular weight phosphatase family protein [Candidatus Heimdallarchaeota archaeon B3_Heim]
MLSQKKVVLFVCTHNSARSQLSEAILEQKFGDHFQTFSAGTKPTTINPYVKQVLTEMGINTSNLKAKHVNEFLGQEIDIIVTVCDSAKESCPYFLGAKRYEHKSFKDPSNFTGTNDERLKAVKRLRDEISEWIEEVFTPKS